LLKNKDIFATKVQDLKPVKLVQHQIDTEDHAPIKSVPYRLSIKEQEQQKEFIKELYQLGLIRKSTSPWRSPPLIVWKKNDPKGRFCVDYRKLNQVTKKDGYPLPRIDDMLDQVAGRVIFTKMDLLSGFWQIAMAEKSKQKTAFGSPALGLWEWECMPFGLTNAPQEFQRLMDSLFSNDMGINGYILIYLDDIKIG